MGTNRKSSNGVFELTAATVLRTRREQLKLLQRDVAELAGVNKKNVSDLESGVIHITLTHLATICPALSWSVAEMIAETQKVFDDPRTRGNALRWHQFAEREQVPIEVPTSVCPSKVKSRQKHVAQRSARRAINKAREIPHWLGGILPPKLEKEHAAKADELRRRNHQRDLEDSPELCETNEG